MSYCCKDKFKIQEVGDSFQLLQGGSVTSVNGKVGAVVLTAEDVGALPDSYEAPVTSVNTQTGDVVLDSGDIAYESTTVEEELGTINSALSSLQSVTEIIDTASGAIASFPDGAGTPMRSLLAQIEPQQEGSGDPSPENVRPITGWTGLSGERTGVNQWDEQWEAGGINTDGQKNGDTTRIRSKNYIPVIGGATYYTNTRIAYFEYDANQTFLRAGNNGSFLGPDVTLTISPDARFILFMCIKDYGTVYKNDIAINLPSTYTAYEPYVTPLPIAVSWQTEAGTVYGGTVDVVTGVLTVETASITFDGSSDEVISQTPLQGYSRFAIVIPDDSMTWTDQSAVTGKLWSNEFKESTNIATGNGTIGIHYRANGSHQIVVGMGTLLPDDLAQFRTWLSNNPLQVVYTLAEPIHYTLTPQQISTLIGNNTVFVDCGSVSVTYQASIKGYIDKVLGA